MMWVGAFCGGKNSSAGTKSQSLNSALGVFFFLVISLSVSWACIFS
jgi:hypothetical protein